MSTDSIPATLLTGTRSLIFSGKVFTQREGGRGSTYRQAALNQTFFIRLCLPCRHTVPYQLEQIRVWSFYCPE